MSVEAAYISDQSGFYDTYRPLTNSYDEMAAAVGVLRPHWEYVVRSLDALGSLELGRRYQEARRLLRENGVTYNVYGDPEGGERFWPLDIVPVLLTSQEWNSIEQGLIQRAELLNLLLTDLYGPRTLIHKGLLPPELIYAHPGFLLPCHGICPPAGYALPLYAADLARAPNGSIWVIGDRAQAPSGAGYALENRIVLSRIFPSLYRDSHVHRVALFFRAVRATLATLALHHQDNPRIVLLTPGPGSETYFEHAYLANYLGCALVQGGDLTVRDGRVWLKTLDGLQPVDVILRRLDDMFCDPLELRRDSLLGTPGLLQAVRLGHVAMVNPLGSGVLENPGLMAFLPLLARHLLGEDLRLPSVATWWCGSDKEREYVLANLHQLVIKPIFPHPSTAIIFGAQLSMQERDALAEQIRARPYLYVGQEQVALSTTPVLVDERLAPRPMVLRSFLVGQDGSYVVMPGGLARVSPSLDTWVVSNQRGGISKDTWVLASEPEREVSLLAPAGRALPLTRSGGEVPGRIAENLFWLGRYAERAENNARLLREVLIRLLESEAIAVDLSMPLLLSMVTQQTGTYPGFVGEEVDRQSVTPEQELLAVILDTRRAGSLRFTVNALVQAARTVRDRLSDDSWRVISGLPHRLVQPGQLSETIEILDRLITELAAFAGLSTERMSRGQGWRFLDIGRRLERGLLMSTLLRVMCMSTLEIAGLLNEVLLTVTDNLSTYRRRYRSQAQSDAVLDLLLLDESNPRALVYQVIRLHEHVIGLPKKVLPPQRSAEERLIIEALSSLRLADIGRLVHFSAGQERREELDQLLARLGYLFRALSDAISNAYFNQTDLPQQLIDIQ
jgi:uncharacterized circularly permuted ATP-grasp superfamily protein/uncharacterized alpha-E superfamily protein